MSHKLILMLGKGSKDEEKQESQPEKNAYKTAQYFRQGKEGSGKIIETAFVGEAILKLFPEKGFEEVHILGTDSSMWGGLVEHFFDNLSNLQDLPSFVDSKKSSSVSEEDLVELSDFLTKHGFSGVKVHCHKIPFGKNEEELWEIFNKIGNIGDSDDKISIDITHSFRHLPFFSFLALVYMRQIKQIEFGSVFYGAFEMKNAFGGKAPIFDLASFLEILDWITAVDRFQNSFAMDSFDFLKERPNIPSKEAGHFVSAIQRVGKDFQINNIAQMIPDLEDLKRKTQKLESEIGDQKGPFGLIAPEIKKTTERILGGQSKWGKYLRMAEAFCQKGHIGNAVLAITEAVIDHICEVLGIEPKKKENSKFIIGLACYKVDIEKIPKSLKRDSWPEALEQQVKTFFKSHPDLAEWDRHFSELREYRNQIAHGFRGAASKTDKLNQGFIQKKISYFRKIFKSNALHGLREVVLGEPK